MNLFRLSFILYFFKCLTVQNYVVIVIIFMGLGEAKRWGRRFQSNYLEEANHKGGNQFLWKESTPLDIMKAFPTM